jgi:hypothetical protein
MKVFIPQNPTIVEGNGFVKGEAPAGELDSRSARAESFAGRAFPWILLIS